MASCEREAFLVLQEYTMTYVRGFFLAFVLCLTAHAADAKTNRHHHPHHFNASWYYKGTKTASGAPFSRWSNTVAHLSLPFGTRVLFINTANGMRACGVVRDRGPYVYGRTWDVSQLIATRLGMIDSGVASLDTVVGGC
jgi:rare lipoprotein A (peptidoglycan hydrolase)